jgi:hypothetical protein
MSNDPNAGPLGKIGIRLKEEDGTKLKENVAAAKSILDSIGSMAPMSDAQKGANEMHDMLKKVGWG